MHILAASDAHAVGRKAVLGLPGCKIYSSHQPWVPHALQRTATHPHSILIPGDPAWRDYGSRMATSPSYLENFPPYPSRSAMAFILPGPAMTLGQSTRPRSSMVPMETGINAPYSSTLKGKCLKLLQSPLGIILIV